MVDIAGKPALVFLADTHLLLSILLGHPTLHLLLLGYGNGGLLCTRVCVLAHDPVVPNRATRGDQILEGPVIALSGGAL